MAIDPRIRARRTAVRRAEGRRRLRFLLVAVGFVACAVGAWALTRTPLLDLDHVHYDGVTGSDAEQVVDAAALASGTAMFDLDLGAVERDVAALPWVETATAEREWPGTVRVTVQPRTPVAVIGLPGRESVLVDASGVLVRPAPEVTTLPRVAIEPSVGLGEVDEPARPGIAVALALPEDLQPWVEAVTLADGRRSDGRVVLGLDLLGSASVHLGAGDFVDDKLAAVRSVLEGVDLSCVEVIDVAVADLPTVTRGDLCADETSAETGNGDA
ncbi:MAG: FtsQ-type POTRA domain-containing protein [Acidimicrobiales bacterium]